MMSRVSSCVFSCFFCDMRCCNSHFSSTVRDSHSKAAQQADSHGDEGQHLQIKPYKIYKVHNPMMLKLVAAWHGCRSRVPWQDASERKKSKLKSNMFAFGDAWSISTKILQLLQCGTQSLLVTGMRKAYNRLHAVLEACRLTGSGIWGK